MSAPAATRSSRCRPAHPLVIEGGIIVFEKVHVAHGATIARPATSSTPSGERPC